MNKKFVILVSAVAALGGLLFGFDTAIISGTIPHITGYFHLDEFMLGWAVSSILIGCAAGALLAGTVADKFGRRSVLIICSILFAVSGIGAGLSHELYLFIFFRLVGGLGVGASAMVSPMYIAETAPSEWRGRLVAFYQLAIVTGILLAYFSNWILSGLGDESWRWMFGSQAAPSLLFLLMLMLVPETPRWLIKQGRDEEAKEILAKTSGDFKTIKNSFRNEKQADVGLLFSPKYKTVLIVGILIAVFQQITGINSILYYAPVIFKEMGLDDASSLLQTIGIGAVNVLSTFIAIGLVDKVGRRKFFLIGSVLMGISLVVIGCCFEYKYFDHYVGLIFMLVYVASFGCTLGAVTWVYLSEIFPNAIRGLALSVATLSLWLADFTVTYTFPVMTSRLGTSMTLFCYAALCALAFVFMLFRVRETKSRSLEEIEILFIK